MATLFAVMFVLVSVWDQKGDTAAGRTAYQKRQGQGAAPHPLPSPSPALRLRVSVGSA